MTGPSEKDRSLDGRRSFLSVKESLAVCHGKEMGVAAGDDSRTAEMEEGAQEPPSTAKGGVASQLSQRGTKVETNPYRANIGSGGASDWDSG